MSKGPRLAPRIKELIDEIYIANRQIRPKEAREKLLEQMKAEGLDQIFGSNYPALNTVSQRLKKLKDKDAARSDELKRLDKPWSLGSLVEYPIPPEALPFVVSIYEKCYSETIVPQWLPSVREALWIGRLYKVIELYHSRHILSLPNAEEEVFLPQGYQEIKLEDLVLDWAYEYSRWEAISEVKGEFVDTSYFDDCLVENVFSDEVYGHRRLNFIMQIAEDYGADADKLEALNLSIMDIGKVAQWASRPQCRIFYVPNAEKSKMSEELLRELGIGSFRSNLVFLRLNKDIPDKLLHKLEKYEVKIYKEAK